MRKTPITLIVIILLFTICNLDAQQLKTFTDSRDDKTYKTVKIGDQIWLAENFAYKPKNATFGGFDGNYWAYSDNEANISKNGYLYDWATAKAIVPKGWRLPTKAEFEILLKHYGDKSLFQSLTEDKNGLNIIYSGWYYQESMDFSHGGNEVGFWSASKKDEKEAFLCILQREYKHVFIRTRFMQGVGAAVRLIKDNISKANNEETAEPVYAEFHDETPKTNKSGFADYLKEYDEIIKGTGYTNENPEIDRRFTEVILKKKNGKLKMVKIIESDRMYENEYQYFYKNSKLFYVFIRLSNSDGNTDEEGISNFTSEKRKIYFSNGKCSQFLFTNTKKNKKYPEYESKASDILKEGIEHLERTENNKWNEF